MGLYRDVREWSAAAGAWQEGEMPRMQAGQGIPTLKNKAFYHSATKIAR